MAPILIFWLVVGASSESPWQDLKLSIEKDRYTSSDTVTLCRVRVENHGTRSWPGRLLRFEAQALEGATVAARETGHFGLSIKPHEALETLVAFPGRYDRFEVHPLTSAPHSEVYGKARGSSGRSKSQRNGHRHSVRPKHGRKSGRH